MQVMTTNLEHIESIDFVFPQYNYLMSQVADIFLNPASKSGFAAMFQNSLSTPSISNLNCSVGLSTRHSHFSIFCAVGTCSWSGRPSQQQTRYAMFWKLRPRLVSHSRTWERPPSTDTWRDSSSSIHLVWRVRLCGCYLFVDLLCPWWGYSLQFFW